MDRIIRIKLDSRQAEQGIDRLDNDMRGLGRTADGLKTRISGVAAAISAVIGGVALQRLGQLSDSWTTFGNRVRQAATSIEKFNAIQEALYRIAQSGRVEIDGVATAFQRIDASVSQFGFSQRDTINVVEGLTKAFAASGATAQEVSSVLVQLGQGLGAGALQGEELRAVLEASIPVSKAIAREFVVSTGQLKKLGEEGKLTTDRVFVALQKALPEFQQAFDKAVPTIAQGATVAGNAITKFVGEFDKLTGVGAAVSQSLIDLADGFDTLTDAVSGGQLSAVTSSYSRQISQIRDEFSNLVTEIKELPSATSEAIASSDNDFVRLARRLVKTVGQALDAVLIDIDLTFDATAAYGGSTAKLLQQAFLNIIPNIRASVQIAVVEIASLIDVLSAQATLGVQAIFSDEAKAALELRLGAIGQAKSESIDAIFAERQADIDATATSIANSKARTEQLRKEREARAGGVGADPLGGARTKSATVATAEADFEALKKVSQGIDSLFSGSFNLFNGSDKAGQNDEATARINQRIAALKLETQTLGSELTLQQGIRQGFISQEQAALDLQTASKIQKAISERDLLLAEKTITDQQILEAEDAFQAQMAAIALSYAEQKQQADLDALATQAQYAQQLQDIQLGAASAALNGIASFAKQGSGLQKALFIALKGIQAAQAYTSGLTAAMLARATIPYPFSEPIALAQITAGKVSAAAILATGIAGSIGGGGGRVGGGGGGASAAVSSGALPTTPQSAPTVQTLEIRGLDEIRDELRNQDGMVSTRFVATILDKISDANRIRGEG